MLSDADIDRLVGRLVAHADPHQVIVFGSYAKGRATAASDLDLLVVLDTDLPSWRRAAALEPVLCTLLPVDLHVHTPEEVREQSRDRFSFLANVLATGRVAYDAATDRRPGGPTAPGPVLS